KVEIQEREIGGFLVVGSTFVGEYSKVGTPMNKVDSVLRSIKIDNTKGIGIFYDDPATTPADKCKSFVGSVLERNDSATIASIKSKGLIVDSIPVRPAMIVEFPIKNRVSYVLGPMKVYPAFKKHKNEKNYKTTMSIELYDIPMKKTYYIM